MNISELPHLPGNASSEGLLGLYKACLHTKENQLRIDVETRRHSGLPRCCEEGRP